MKAIVVGGGVGGLAAGLALHARGIAVELHEQAETIRELGVGINTLPHAIAELAELGLLPALDAVAVRTSDLIYANRFGQTVWQEPRGIGAGFPVPQFSIHRGRLQGVLHAALADRIGPEAVRTDCRLVDFTTDPDGVTARFCRRDGSHAVETRGDVLIAADGIHSMVRGRLVPDEGPPRWTGRVLWRGATDWPAFRDGHTMIVAGGLAAKLVVYPIADGSGPSRRLTNWAIIATTGVPGDPPPRQDWSKPAHRPDVEAAVARFRLPDVDAPALVAATAEIFEYPMCDRDPLPRWSHGRVTLLGDAAHPMYPVGSNGASQAILDARCLADSLAAAEDPAAGLAAYEAVRLPLTAAIVRANRTGGPEGVIDAVEALAPDGFDDIEAVLSHADREAIVRGYARQAGFTPDQVGRAA